MYYKISNLSACCWEAVVSIMNFIKSGSLPQHAHKKQRNKNKVVYQSLFSFLAGFDPIKNENEMFERQCEYKNGTIPEKKGNWIQNLLQEKYVIITFSRIFLLSTDNFLPVVKLNPIALTR